MSLGIKFFTLLDKSISWAFKQWLLVKLVKILIKIIPSPLSLPLQCLYVLK